MTCLQTDSVRPKELFYLFSGWLFQDYLAYLVQHISRDESHSAWSIVLAAGLFLHDTKPLLAAEQSTLQAMGRPASHCWHKLVYHGISFMPLPLSEDWSSFATNFEVESLPTEVPQILSASHLHFPILSPRSNPWPQHHRQWKPTARQLPQPPVCLSSKSGHFLSANNILYWQ